MHGVILLPLLLVLLLTVLMTISPQLPRFLHQGGSPFPLAWWWAGMSARPCIVQEMIRTVVLPFSACFMSLYLCLHHWLHSFSTLLWAVTIVSSVGFGTLFLQHTDFIFLIMNCDVCRRAFSKELVSTLLFELQEISISLYFQCVCLSFDVSSDWTNHSGVHTVGLLEWFPAKYSSL